MSSSPNFRRGAQAAAAADVEVQRLTRGRSANRYPGDCRLCGLHVGPLEGIAYQGPKGWIVEHKDGQCPMPVTVTRLPRIEAKNGQVYTGRLLPGIYTMVDNRGEHVTYRVRVQASDADFAPGEAIIEYLSGPDNDSDYTPFGFVRDSGLVVWKRYRLRAESDPDLKYRINGALALLRDPSRAKVSRNCIRCNATLTTPESIEAGMGPTCRDKGW